MYKTATTDTRVTGEVFNLDTSNFNDVAEKSRSLSEKMATLKNDLDRLNGDLMSSWAGEGRNTFEKKYSLLSQQFGDLKDSLRDISESLLSMEEEYIQADTELSKAIEGKDSRY